MREVPKSKVPMVLVTFHIPIPLLRELDRLVEEGKFPSRSEAIRHAIIQLLARERQRTQIHEVLVA